MRDRYALAVVLVATVVAACANGSAGSPAAGSASPEAAGSAAPGASGPCVDAADLADTGEPIESAWAVIKTALAAQKVDDARAAAQTASHGLEGMADIVGAASPQAKELFLSSATQLRQAADQFPAGADKVDQARNDFEHAYDVAREARCP